MISATATTIITAATALLLQAISFYKPFRKLGKEKKRKENLLRQTQLPLKSCERKQKAKRKNNNKNCDRFFSQCPRFSTRCRRDSAMNSEREGEEEGRKEKAEEQR